MTQIELQELLLELWNHEVDVDFVIWKLNNEPSARNDAKPIVSRRVFVNIYGDANGRFLGDEDYDSYEAAFENRDQLSTYVETVEIVRQHGG